MSPSFVSFSLCRYVNLKTAYLLPSSSAFLTFQKSLTEEELLNSSAQGSLYLSWLRASVQITCPACLSIEGMTQHADIRSKVWERMINSRHLRKSLSNCCWPLCIYVYICVYIHLFTYLFINVYIYLGG